MPRSRLLRWLLSCTNVAPTLRADPKPFLGYSDNTNILNWIWTNGVAGFYGGSTQVHLGPGPNVDPVHLDSLTAALLNGGELEVTEPGESEDFGLDWADSRALSEFGEREATESWTWAGPSVSVTGRTWGGCLDVLDWVALADRMPKNDDLAGAILLLETSEELHVSCVLARWSPAIRQKIMSKISTKLNHQRACPQRACPFWATRS